VPDRQFINPRLPRLWHGGDYNPDQWPEEVRAEDLRLMPLAHVNAVSVGIFSWSQLEPRPGEYAWEWLDELLDSLHETGVSVALATPSAAHPRWLTALHPEVMAVGRDGVRMLHGQRQRFCPTTPVYRGHVARMNRALAERYGQHPALVLWHVSNEYANTCWCDLCVAAWRVWLQDRYGSLETLNAQWWSTFWSQRFSDWSEVIPPYTHAGRPWQGPVLDWRRFQSHQVCQFFKHEVAALREVSKDVPVTTNLMGIYPGLDYAKFADVMDVISWDSYPVVGEDPAGPAFRHSLMRGLKENRPWLLIEQSPSATNWQEYGTLKPPGLMRLQSWQAVAHGSDAVMYFQWRRSRGAGEKFHGAVVEHAGTEKARVFQEVAALGAELESLSETLAGSLVAKARIGVIWDQESRWALEGVEGFARDKQYAETIQRHFRAVWRHGFPVDVVRMDADWTQYDVLIAPLLYMVKSGEFPLQAPPEELHGRIDEAAKIEEWVKSGGTFVTTYLSGLVNESDLVYEGGYPGPLRRLLGIWVEETDATPPGVSPNHILLDAASFRGARREYTCDRFFDLVHPEGAEVLARYRDSWYAKRPALTRNRFGAGEAFYLATDPEDAFLEVLYHAIARNCGLEPLCRTAENVEILERHAGGVSYLFLLNHAAQERTADLGARTGTDLLTGEALRGKVKLGAYGVRIVAPVQEADKE